MQTKVDLMTPGATLQRHPAYLVIGTLVSTCAGFLFGYDTLVLSGAIDYLSRFFGLDAPGIGWAASCAVIGTIIGSATAGWIIDALGVKFGLWLCTICFATSSVGTGFFANTLIEFTLWRMLAGLAIGMTSIVAPMYMAEIAPARIRGRLVTLYQLGIVLGILSAVFTNMLIQRMGDDAWNVATGWRWMFFVGVAPTVLLGAMLPYTLESPRWLMKVNRCDEADAVLCKLDGPEKATAEASQIRQSLRQEEGSLTELLNTGLRRALVIGIMLTGLSQASGIFCLLSFLPEVFKAAGTTTGDAFLQTVLVGAVLAVFTLVASALVDVVGRKVLILVGTFLQFISLATVGWLYYTHGNGLFILVCIMLFVAAHAVGNGSVCWVIISEMFPTRVRGRAMSIGTTSLGIVAFVGNLIFPTMQSHLGHSGTFWCFSGAALINLIYVFFWVPETKGRSLEQIENIWYDHTHFPRANAIPNYCEHSTCKDTDRAPCDF